jgi:transcriptional regulator with XRE-family HTH domain
MDVRKRIGWNVRRLRAERGLTQENFGTDSRFDRGFLSGIERGVRNPSIRTLERLATALDVDVSDLLDEAKAVEFEELRRRR